MNGSSEIRLFVVRVWRERLRGFRASVRSPDEEAPRLFTEAAAVASFLAAEAGQTEGEGDEQEAERNR